jgi:YHS domain-containing protein
VARSQGTLVQDPVCGTYVLQERALTARGAGGTIAYFCSERCRSAYDAQAARPH